MPALNLEELTQSADLVLVGEVTSVKDLYRTVMEVRGHLEEPVTIRQGEMRVDTILKGSTDSSAISFQFIRPDLGYGYEGVSAHIYRVLFLKKVITGYEFASPLYPSVVAVPGFKATAGSSLNQVIEQIEKVLTSDAPSEQKHEAVFDLRNTQNKSVVDALHLALQDKNLDVRLNVAGALLLRNDLSGLPLAEQALLNPPPQVPAYLVQNLWGAIQSGVRDERAIPALARLLAARDVDTRRAVAFALRNTASRTALIPLVSALKDSDFQARYYAVIGLAEITGDSEWRPSQEDFKANEARYLQYWKSWAKTNLI